MAFTPEQITLIETTWAAASKNGDELTKQFYGTLFTKAPQARAMFPDDLTEQRKKLGQTVGLLVGSLRKPEAILPALREMGARHVGYGAVEAQYPLICETLVETLGDFAGETWSEEAAQAWTAALTVVSDTMIAGAREFQAKAA